MKKERNSAKGKKMEKKDKSPYQEPEIKTFDPEELREELGLTLGSPGQLQLL